ncbi:peptidase M13 [Brevibacterium sp. BRM-1]|uniref:M13 family metallopeptidase n=1 Tax=Brevibacterium sp. BRM-1 TaxID=2999062 RepID=UPI002280BB8E|nr:M13-type metalloendopeptidase [Brevibacterium sp. BRM-1]WAL39355.1 peptidase M13 [Brevibacterium sp. BRM-1]
MTSSSAMGAAQAKLYGDPSVTPGTDLFRSVNGRWLAEHEIPEDRSGDGAMRELVDASEEAVRDLIGELAETEHPAGSAAQKIADLFRSFMDADAIEEAAVAPLTADFERIAAVADKSQLAELMGRLERTGAGGIYRSYVSADARNSDVYALYLDQGGIHLPDEVYYRGTDYQPLRDAYRSHIAAMSRIAGLSAHTGLSDEALAAAVFDFETKLAAHHWDNVATRDAEATYNLFSLQEMAELARGFDFGAWARGAGIDRAASAVAGEPSFFTGSGRVWEETDLATLKAWLIFNVLEADANLLHRELVEENFDFYGRTLSGTPAMRERWKRGVGVVEALLGEAVGKLYVERHFPPDAKAAIQDLVDKLIRAYEHSIRTIDWMGEETKARALDKLALFAPKVGYPDAWRDYPAEVRPDDLIGNVRRAAAAEHERQIARIAGPIDRTEWFMTPQTVNAYYHPVLNEIVFPAAILQPPFFDPEASDAANFGAIGAVIGHEIGHGFDDQGSRYDGHGNLVNWWTEADRDRFDELTRALIDQYEALIPTGFGASEHVNGALTIGENIGDLGGLSIAWKALGIAADDAGREVTEADARDFFSAWAGAWRAKFRREERLRRLSIDPHAPEEFRCNQVVKNIEAFYTAFGVGEDDEMYLAPERRVSIW